MNSLILEMRKLSQEKYFQFSKVIKLISSRAMFEPMLSNTISLEFLLS